VLPWASARREPLPPAPPVRRSLFGGESQYVRGVL